MSEIKSDFKMSIIVVVIDESSESKKVHSSIQRGSASILVCLLCINNITDAGGFANKKIKPD